LKLHITTQYMENYGAHDWDGQGECPQRWKFKGGEDYFYALGDVGRSEEALAELVEVLRPRFEYSNEGSRNYMVGYSVVADDFMTEYEQSQLEYDGRVAYPAIMLQPLVDVQPELAV
jgi:hypothetical protein